MTRLTALLSACRRMLRWIWRLRDYPGGAAGLYLLTFVVGLVLLGPLFYRHSAMQQDYLAVMSGPSRAYPLGTDDLGRDLLARVMAGGRVTLKVSLLSVGLAAPVGIALGLVAGYARGWASSAMATVLDALLVFPLIVLALAITASLGVGTASMVIAFAVALTPLFARIARGETLALREKTYVEAARAAGVSRSRIAVRHILPNMMGPLIVQGSLALAFVILAEAGLSFLGVGVQPPQAAWGSMLRRGVPNMERSPWVVFVPGVAVWITVLGLNRLGDALREALDPRVERMVRASSLPGSEPLTPAVAGERTAGGAPLGEVARPLESGSHG